MAEEDEESLRQRLTREREQRRDDGQLERFREGKFKPINSKQREQLERRMAQSDPPPALQRPPQPAAKVEAGLGGLGGNPITFYAWREGQIGTFSLLASGSFTPLGAPP